MLSAPRLMLIPINSTSHDFGAVKSRPTGVERRVLLVLGVVPDPSRAFALEDDLVSKLLIGLLR